MLFDEIIFGPVQSRRLGVSLGVNLLSPTAKLCNFDCIYCECGWNDDSRGGVFNRQGDVLHSLEAKLKWMASEGNLPNYITFAGNGEPTMHPLFLEIIRGTVALRDKYAPEAKVAVLTNATMIERPQVREALGLVERPILKFDSAVQSTYERLNKPQKKRTIEQIVELLEKMEGQWVMQTMVLRGGGIDNTTDKEVGEWLEVVQRVRPSEVMLYSIDRPTPQSGLQKVEKDELENIAQRVRLLGIEAVVS